MRLTKMAVVASAALLLVACGKKKAPEAAADATPATTAPAPAPEPEAPPEPEPEPEPEPPKSNADFNAVITLVDGTTHSGHVKRVERGHDWYAENGYSDDSGDLKLELEGNGTLVEKTWDEIDRIDIAYEGRSGIDCTYDSNFTPWMYMCVLRNTPKTRTTDGKTWTVTTRNKWKFPFDDDSEVEFYVHKLPAREQDDEAAGLDSVENYDLYGKLQGSVMELAKTSAVKSIDINK